MTEKKQYGLVIPKKTNQGLVKKLAVFGGDSDSDDSEGGKDWVRKSLQLAATKTTLKRQTKMDLQRAEEEDATVFQYDEVYDQMDKEREEKTALLKGKDKKPKYIEQLLKNAEKRKVENERRVERQVQKEREAEGEEFADKEVFVTSAYKKKLEEFAKLDEEQKRQDFLEEIGDVTKQEDISGFYRHLYETTVAHPSEKKPVKVPQLEVKEEPPEEEKGEGEEEKRGARHYRKRKGSESSGEKMDKDTDMEESSSESEADGEKEELEAPKETVKVEIEEAVVIKEEPLEEEAKGKEVIKTSVWEKRTVGSVLEAALERYRERKAARMERGH